jgi:hypothetical protein
LIAGCVFQAAGLRLHRHVRPAELFWRKVVHVGQRGSLFGLPNGRGPCAAVAAAMQPPTSRSSLSRLAKLNPAVDNGAPVAGMQDEVILSGQKCAACRTVVLTASLWRPVCVGRVRRVPAYGYEGRSEA